MQVAQSTSSAVSVEHENSQGDIVRRWFEKWGNQFFCVWTVVFLVWDVYWALVGQWWMWIVAAIMAVALVLQVRLTRRVLAFRRAHAIDSLDEPTAPENVRVELEDGTIVPVELRYVGRADDGYHQWLAVTPIMGMSPDMQLLADMIPGNTSIAIQGYPRQ